MKQKICHLLRLFGLDETDCNVYLCLVNSGTISASTISAKLQVERNKVYRTLVKLKNHGLAESTFSNPVLYRVDSIPRGLSEIVKKKADELETLKKLSSIITDNLIESEFPKMDIEKPTLSIIQGRDNIYSKIGKIFENCTHDIYFCTTSSDLLNLYYTAIPEKIQIAKKNGARINIITDFQDNDTNNVLKKINPTEIRYTTIPSRSRLLVEQENQIIMSDVIKDNMNLNEPNDTIFHSTSHSMIESMMMFCESLWKNAHNDPLKVNKLGKIFEI